MHARQLKLTIKDLIAGNFSREEIRESLTFRLSQRRQQVYKLWDNQVIHFDGRPEQMTLLDGTIINFPAYGRDK
jgi:hypothetical protein